MKLYPYDMKKTLFFLVLLGGLSSSSLWAQYGIGTNRPNQSAALEIVSPDKGILIPTITLTNSSTFAPITGTSSTTHNGMLVWNDSASTTNGLDGPGFYFWQNTATAGVGFWYKVNSTDDGTIPQTGTVTNSTLRWDGTAWVENTGLLSDGTNTTSLTTVLHVGNNVTVTGTLEVTGTSTLATTTINNDLTVVGSSTLATTTLTGVLQDYDGDNGTAGQVLSSTGTSTQWIDNYAPASGTTTNSTLRWDGSEWVESMTILQTGAATGSATIAANTTVTGTLAVTNSATLSSDLTVQGSTTLATTTLTGVLQDYDGDNGTAGQVLSSTGTSTQWIDNYAPASGTTTHTTLRWDGKAWVENIGLQSDGTTTSSMTTSLRVANNATVTGTVHAFRNFQAGENNIGNPNRLGFIGNSNTYFILSNNAVPVGVSNYFNNFNGNTALLFRRLAGGSGKFLEGQNNLGDTQFEIGPTGGAYFGDDVGIGTTTPAHTLQVSGTAQVTGALHDSSGDAGTAGQVLSSTGTQTNWIDNSAPIAGTVTHTTLRWNGSAWVENHGLLSDGSNTTSLTTALHVGNNATVTGTLEVTENATLTSDLVVGENTTASGTLTAISTVTLESALVDATGSAGTAGQVLSSTGTGTQWIDNTTASLAMMSNTGAVTPTVTILLLTPSGGGSDMTVTLADATLINVGFEIKIRRNEGYTGTNDSITLDGNAAQTIDGQATRKLDVGYQSITLVNTGSAWVSVD